MAPPVAPLIPCPPDGDAGALADLERLAHQLAAGLDRRRPLLHPRSGRRWTSLLDHPDRNAWLIGWAPGSGLALHEHGDACAAVTVVAGELHERFTDGSRTDIRRRTLPPGTTVSFGRDHVHEVVNRGVTAAWSIHVYSPRLERVTFVEPALAGFPGA